MTSTGWRRRPSNSCVVRRRRYALASTGALHRHEAAHRALFRRCDVVFEQPAHLAAGDDVGYLPTDARLARHERGGADPGLTELMFQYGRYLLIASSRGGTNPANLQGIWNAQVRPPWSSNYTTNINLEMNYWPAEVTGLSECHDSLLNWLHRVAPRGRDGGSGAVRAPGLGHAPQLRHVGLVPSGRGGGWRPLLVVLAYGCGLACPTRLGPLRVHPRP